MVERVAVSDVIHDDYAVAAAIIRCRDRPKSFLAGRVPNLHFYDFAVDCDRFDLEIDADRRNIIIAEYIFGETDEQAAFAGAGVADKKNL